MVWTDELTGAVEQENFLLDNGRLKLKTIQQAFSASLVRMCIGNFCILVSVILLINITPLIDSILTTLTQDIQCE